MSYKNEIFESTTFFFFLISLSLGETLLLEPFDGKVYDLLPVSLPELLSCPSNHLSGFVQAMEFWKNYGILKRKFHVLEKLWNLSKTAVPMEKLWNFRFGGKRCVLSFKKWGENTSGLRNVVSMCVASVITSLGLAL